MKRVLILLFILSVCVTGCGCKKKNKDNYPKLPETVNYDISQKQVVDGIQIDNISLLKDENGMSHFKANVTNKNKTKYSIKTLVIILKDSKDKEVETLTGYLDTKLEPDETRRVSATSISDLDNVKKVSFDIKN